MLRKAGANWVDGDRFFDREVELEALAERVRDGTHTLLTAQRRIGKTSLVRELLRRLDEEGRFETVFVDLEDAAAPADAVAEIGARSRSVQGAWPRIKSGFANALREAGDRVDLVTIAEVQVKLRAGIDTGNWRQKGDEVFAALAESDRPVVLAIDELPILVNRLLKGADHRITPERRQAVDEFLGWLRKNGQTHRGRVILILAGSVSLEPILAQAGLSAHANIYSPLRSEALGRPDGGRLPRGPGPDLPPRPSPRRPPGDVPPAAVPDPPPRAAVLRQPPRGPAPRRPARSHDGRCGARVHQRDARRPRTDGPGALRGPAENGARKGGVWHSPGDPDRGRRQ